MPTFTYKAADKTGKLIKGNIEADTQQIAVVKLQGLSYLPIKVEELKNKKQSFSLDSFDISFLNSVSEQELMIFTQQLYTLIDSGVPIDRCLTILIDLIEKKSLKAMVIDIQKNVHSGISFAEALSKHPKAFSNLYINMVKAGEEGGILGIILERLAQFLESSHQLKETVKSAMIYPILLTFIGGGAVAFLLTFVVPRFAKIFMDMGQVIPLPTQILLNISSFLVEYSFMILLGIGLFIILIKVLLSSTRGKEAWDGTKLRMPLIGDLIKKIEVSRFSRTLGTLVKSGVPILKALIIVKDTINNTSIAKSMNNLHKGLKRGAKVSEPLKNSKIFPAMAMHMITVGEETGQLENMLIKVADTYDKEVKLSVDKMISLIEPLMILFMGLVVGFIVVSMLLAIFSVNDIPF